MHERLIGVRRALTEAPVDQLVERLAEVLAKIYGLTEVTLLQVDYRLAVLLPLGGGDPVTRSGSPAWRSFDQQTEVVQEGVAHLPVTMRGERAGVLRLAPAPDDDVLRAERAEIATLLAHELAAVRCSTDRYTVAARSQRLTLAAEMQWDLLPGRSRSGASFELAGQLEPAYAVRGDTFDWTDDGHRLWLSVVNGMGEGVAAAALTALATNALRNARRAGLALADQATLAGQAVFAYHRGPQHVDALLLELDLETGVVTAVDAGSPQLLLLRGAEVLEQPLEAQFPLGMFDDTIYQPQCFELQVGDRLLVVSDGIFDAASQSTRYGDSALKRFTGRARWLSPLDAVRSLLGDVRAFVGGDLIDDAVAVCLDRTGPRR
jgi:serine phosphatase RsbU (regulator of sigma subunit)